MRAIYVDHTAKTVRPVSDSDDAYFGLGPGTNGTAAICRRALVQPEGYNWTRASGAPASGILYVPGNTSQESVPGPWDGELMLEVPEPEPEEEEEKPEPKRVPFIPMPDEEPLP